MIGKQLSTKKERKNFYINAHQNKSFHFQESIGRKVLASLTLEFVQD